MSDTFMTLIKMIVSVHKELIGPYAIQVANRVPGLSISKDLATIDVQGEEKAITGELVQEYKKLFGNTSIELCKEAREDLLPSYPKENLPDILQ